MKKTFFGIIFLTSYCNLPAQKIADNIRAGNSFYKQQDFTKAAEEYDKALAADPANTTAKFNKGNALYRLEKQVEAAEQYADVARSSSDKLTKSKAYYNKGVILSRQKNIGESIEAYKNALRNNPDDKEARENLQKALLELKKKQPPPKKESDQQKKQQEQQKKNQQPKISPKDADQRLKLLQQKEKQVQQKMQKEKSKTGGSQSKDW